MRNFLLLTLVIALSGISFVQAQVPNGRLYGAGFRPARRFHPPRQMRRPQAQPLRQMPQQIQPLMPQEMQQLNQLVPPITGKQNMPPASGLPGSVMSKRERVKNYEVLQRVGNIYIMSSPGKHTYVLRTNSLILRKYKCHIEYPYTYCAKKHKKAHKPKHGLY